MDGEVIPRAVRVTDYCAHWVGRGVIRAIRSVNRTPQPLGRPRGLFYYSWRVGRASAAADYSTRRGLGRGFRAIYDFGRRVTAFYDVRRNFSGFYDLCQIPRGFPDLCRSSAGFHGLRRVDLGRCYRCRGSLGVYDICRADLRFYGLCRCALDFYALYRSSWGFYDLCWSAASFYDLGRIFTRLYGTDEEGRPTGFCGRGRVAFTGFYGTA